MLQIKIIIFSQNDKDFLKDNGWKSCIETGILIYILKCKLVQYFWRTLGEQKILNRCDAFNLVV